MKRTKQEIDNEISRLRALRPIGALTSITVRMIAEAITELTFPFDRSATEWNELDKSTQKRLQKTADWRDGYSEERPSEGWGNLVASANMELPK